MSQPSPPAPGARTAALLHRVEAVESALDRAGDAVPAQVQESVRAILAGVRERLALGVDHTIVALAGGTGSGKSSLFNALTGLEFSEVGVRRPTTSRTTACVWAHDATALLDWLGVPRDRRIERESELDGESQADLRGLVLLDLPDHDSVEPAHRAVVDRLLPHADLLTWVLDPQKYADDALHTGYLRHLAGHEAVMLVVLNQIDTVPTDARAALMRDVDRLLREDGLTDVGVHGVSARTGEGVVGVRAVLARAVAERGIAEVRAAAELDDAARALAEVVGPAEVDSRTLPVDAAVDGAAEAAGLPGLLQGVRGSSGRGSLRSLGPVQADRAANVRRSWLARSGAGLPQPWAEALDRAVAAEEDFARDLDRRLATVPVPPLRHLLATTLRVLAAVLGIGALAVVGVGVGTVLGASGWTDTATVVVLAAGVLGLLALAAYRLARVAGRGAARRRAEAIETAVRSVIEDVVEERLGRPTARVLADHRAVREAAVVPERPPRSLHNAAPTDASTG